MSKRDMAWFLGFGERMFDAAWELSAEVERVHFATLTGTAVQADHRNPVKMSERLTRACYKGRRGGRIGGSPT